MAGTLLFLHGTGVRDVSASMESIRQGAKDVLDWGSDQVVAVEWGKEVGPQPLDIGPVLPPTGTRAALGDDATEAAVIAARWDILLADPMVELRVLAATDPSGSSAAGLGLDGDSPSVTITRNLGGLSLESAALETAEVKQAALEKARDDLVNDATVGQAAESLGDPDNDALLSAIARAVVAIALQADPEDEPSRALRRPDPGRIGRCGRDRPLAHEGLRHRLGRHDPRATGHEVRRAQAHGFHAPTDRLPP